MVLFLGPLIIVYIWPVNADHFNTSKNDWFEIQLSVLRCLSRDRRDIAQVTHVWQDMASYKHWEQTITKHEPIRKRQGKLLVAAKALYR